MTFSNEFTLAVAVTLLVILGAIQTIYWSVRIPRIMERFERSIAQSPNNPHTTSPYLATTETAVTEDTSGERQGGASAGRGQP